MSRSFGYRVQSLQTPALLCLFVAIVSQAWRLSAVLEQAVLVMLATMIMVIGLYVFVGNSGVFSFGHTGLAMIGGYAVGILAIPVSQKKLLDPTLFHVLQTSYAPSWLAVLIGGACAAVAGLVLSLCLARMSGLTAGLATFIVLLIIYNVASNLNGVTNGTSGVTDIASVGSPWVLLLWTFGAIWLAAGYQLTDACQRLRASREDEFAAQSVGIRIARSRAAAFALSAFVTGVGGAVYAQVQGTVSPDTYYLQLAVVVIAMLVIGGVRSLTGAVVGTVCISAINQLSTQVENGVSIGPVSITGPTGLEQIVLGLAMLAILLLRPAGLTGGREVRLPIALSGFGPRRDRAKQPARGEAL